MPRSQKAYVGNEWHTSIAKQLSRQDSHALHGRFNVTNECRLFLADCVCAAFLDQLVELLFEDIAGDRRDVEHVFPWYCHGTYKYHRLVTDPIRPWQNPLCFLCGCADGMHQLSSRPLGDNEPRRNDTPRFWGSLGGWSIPDRGRAVQDKLEQHKARASQTVLKDSRAFRSVLGHSRPRSFQEFGVVQAI